MDNACNLCGPCSTLLTTPENVRKLNRKQSNDTDGGLTLTRLWRTTFKNAKAGCRLCQVFLSEFTIAMHGILPPPATPSLLERLSSILVPRKIRLRLTYTEPRSIGDVNEFEIERERDPGWYQTVIMATVSAKEGDPAAEVFPTRPFLRDFASDHATELMRKTSRRCVENHDACPKPSRTCLPHRVICVSGTPRLIETTADSTGYYAVLSYCWGMVEQPVMATVQTISKLQERIPLETLPQTIKDAITITRKIGCQYLWVDSLCILQDDKYDKNIQIGQIPHIFSNALFTIYAASAANCNDGMLDKRRPIEETWTNNVSVDVEIPYLCPDGRLGQLIIQPLAIPLPPPISQRAWTLEERLISPRLFSFGTNYLSWHCFSEPTILEGAKAPGTAENPLIPSVMEETSLLKDIRLGMTNEKCSDQELWARGGRWTLLLEEYTRRGVTSPEDRLRAVAGLAAIYQGALRGCSYQAGLWHGTRPNNRNFLLSQLLWFEPSSKAASRQTPLPVDPSAPSWSWASTQSEVQWFPPATRDFLTTKIPDAFWDENHDLAEVIECTHTAVNIQNIYGPVSDARVTIRGPFRTVLALPCYQRYVRFPLGISGSEFVHVNLDMGCPAMVSLLPEYPGHLTRDKIHESMECDVSSPRSGGTKSRRRTGGESERPSHKQIGNREHMLSFLLIKQRTGLVLTTVEGENLYRRIGVFALVDIRTFENPKYTGDDEDTQMCNEAMIRLFDSTEEGDYHGNDLETREAFFGQSIETVTII